MVSRWLRALAVLALVPATALAFEVVDTLVYPSRGAFPEAYPPDPLYPTTLWAQFGMMVDSNPFRLSGTADTEDVLGDEHRSDTVLRYGIGAGHVARVVGRQGVRLIARGEYYDYLRHNRLDHFAYGLRGEWLWALGNDLSGIAGYTREDGLADTAGTGGASTDEVSVDRLYANGEYRLGPLVRLRAGASEERGKREGDRPTLVTTSTTLFGGIGVATPLGNAIGVEYRRSEGAAPPGPLLDPTGQFADNRYSEDELALVVLYNLSAQLRVAGRVGQTTREYNILQVEDFEGTTGRVTIGWLASPKFGMELAIYREPRGVLEVDATHVDVRGTRFGISWAPAYKLVFSASFVNDRRVAQASLVDPSILPADDSLRTWRFAAGWEPRRHITVGTGVAFGERTSNTLGRDYDYLQVMANLRYDW
jgi:hypothetical protein